MSDYSELMLRARKDTECAMKVWGDTLPKFFGSRLDYVYTKGSALKKWDSHIDYVPIISDVDIHIGLIDNEPLFEGSSKDFDDALELSALCEKEFLRLRPNHLHVPRMQVIETRFLEESDKYTPPRPKDVLILFGKPDFGELPTPEIVRAGDLERILEDTEFIIDLPRRTLDRTGLDFWSIIRQMVWRVAPSPVRILTQTQDDPIDVWSWNRTKIHQELLEAGYESIANYYYGFYTASWKLYLSNFQGLDEFRETTKNGYYVLYECWKEARRIGGID